MKSRKVLIVDDDAVYRKMLRPALVSWGYEVVEAHDGLCALQQLTDEHGPQLAIVDWVMPGLDGPELCRRIRSQNTSAYTYLLLLTVKSDRHHVLVGLDAGADDYLCKPFDPAEVEQRLRAGERILDMQDRLIEAQEALTLKANIDPLTGLNNRGAILEILENECERRRRRNIAELGVAVVDVDHFKRVNDVFGHSAGDRVLCRIARLLAEHVRPYDSVGRYGGDEFVVVLPGAAGATTRGVADRLRRATAGLGVTLSIGVAAAGANPQPAHLIQQADAALFRAKAGGRDQAYESLPADGSERESRLLEL